MRKNVKRLVAYAAAFSTLLSTTSLAYAESNYVNGGRWIDKKNLVWEYNDGATLDVGRGSIFSEIHPEIADPEYYLKEYYCYPDETETTYKSQGQIKTPYNNCMDEAFPLLKEFLHSFDWINSDEATRYEKVYARIASGQSGNVAGGAHTNQRWQILRTGTGVCEEFSTDFANLCKLVGLECVTYQPSVNHSDCLMKIGQQWLTVNPTDGTVAYSNSHLVPVDFETEYNRYANEVKNSEWYQEQMQHAEWWKQVEAGEMTKIEYYQRLYPDMSESEIQEKFLSWDGYVEGLGNN
ncbi:hypothetical protein QE152_g40892 [Popillia japonica]|uniref:Transglutaminase-like domain-containing protein n=1 Tax=Popillia japonica TaxID=7064 RepID=A0AAW1HF10_POPJA